MSGRTERRDGRAAAAKVDSMGSDTARASSWGGFVSDVEFQDREGVTWRVTWRSAGADVRVVGSDRPDRAEAPAGFEFTCEAVTFRSPWATFTDPRAVRGEVLQRMIDRALGA